MQETSDGIVYPDGGDEYALVADLGAMSESIQRALAKRANNRAGTQVQRINSSGLPDGTLWKDTTGDRALWVLDQGQWIQVWPDPIRRMLYVGTANANIGNPFVNLRRMTSNGTRVDLTLQQSGENFENNAGLLYGFLDNQITNNVGFMRDGRIYSWTTEDNVTRWLPRATWGTRVARTITGPDTTDSFTVNFPSGLFTQPPIIQLSVGSDLPQGYSISFTGTTTNSVRVHLHRSAAGTWTPVVNVLAIQPGNWGS